MTYTAYKNHALLLKPVALFLEFFFWGGEGNWAISLFMTLPELKICHDYLKILNGMATALYNQVTA